MHANWVLHRDLKPANGKVSFVQQKNARTNMHLFLVLLTSEGVVKTGIYKTHAVVSYIGTAYSIFYQAILALHVCSIDRYNHFSMVTK